MNLTNRQRAVLERFLAGHSVTAIAREFKCSERTVRAHLAAIAVGIDSPHPPMRRLLVHGPALLTKAG